MFLVLKLFGHKLQTSNVNFLTCVSIIPAAESRWQCCRIAGIPCRKILLFKKFVNYSHIKILVLSWFCCRNQKKKNSVSGSTICKRIWMCNINLSQIVSFMIRCQRLKRIINFYLIKYGFSLIFMLYSLFYVLKFVL